MSDDATDPAKSEVQQFLNDLDEIRPGLSEDEASVFELLIVALDDIPNGRTMTVDELKKKLGR